MTGRVINGYVAPLVLRTPSDYLGMPSGSKIF